MAKTLKRFYKQVEIRQLEGNKQYEILLDGRALKTPMKQACLAPTKGLAEAIQQEWQSQEEDIILDDMIMTKLLNTAHDRVALRRDELIDELVRYANNDLLCYWADYPTALIEQQEQAWRPILNHMRDVHGLSFTVQQGIMHQDQAEETLFGVRQMIEPLDAYRLTAFHNIVTSVSSVMLGLRAVFDGEDVDVVWSLSRIDEEFQIKQWGSDEEAEKKTALLKRDLDNAYGFLRLL